MPIFPGVTNGHIIIDATIPEGEVDNRSDYEHPIPIAMQPQAATLDYLLQRLDLRLYRALARIIIGRELNGGLILPSPAWPGRYRYVREHRR